MLNDFSDRHPKLLVLLILLFTTAVPGAFTYFSTVWFGEDFPIAKVIFAVAFAANLILWLTVEKPLVNALPFIISLIGVLGCEVLYLSVSSTAGGWSLDVKWLYDDVFSLGVAVFGPEVTAAVAALLSYVAISFVRSIIGK